MKFSALLLLAVCVLGQRFPGRSWERATPASQNMDPARLDAALRYAFPPLGLTTYCVAVFRNGYLVADRYLVGRGPTTTSVSWSVSKAVFSTLIGIAEQNGWLNANDLASRYIPEWNLDARARRITIDMLLRHDSGRYFETLNDFVIPQESANQTLFALGLPMQREPGTVDQYNQMAFQCMERIWRRAAPARVVDLFDQLLAGPLGFESDSFWQEVSFLVNRPNGDGGLVYGGLHSSCHDLGRFGHLWLNRGNWNGRRIVTPEFIERGLRRATPPRAGRQYHWGGGPNHRANGLGDQFVSFNREKNLVIARLGDMTSAGFRAGTLIDMVMQSLLDGEGSWNATKDAENDIDPAEVAWGEQLQKLMKETPGKEIL